MLDIFELIGLFFSCSRAPEIDISELESLFSAAIPSSDQGGRTGSSRASLGQKLEKVQLVITFFLVYHE